MTEMDRRTDPWGEFLRRILLSASLAGVAGMTAAAPDNAAPSSGVMEPDQTGEPDQPVEPSQVKPPQG